MEWGACSQPILALCCLFCLSWRKDCFICCHTSSGTTRFFSRKPTKQRYPVSGSLCEEQSGLACMCKPRGCPSQTTSCPGFLEAGGPRWRPRARSPVTHALLKGGDSEAERRSSATKVPRQCEDTLATISSYKEPCFSKLTGDHEAQRGEFSWPENKATVEVWDSISTVGARLNPRRDCSCISWKKSKLKYVLWMYMLVMVIGNYNWHWFNC